MEQAVEKKTKVPVPKYSWAVLIMLYLAAATAPINMFKVPSLAPLLMEGLAIPVTDIGLLMSVFSIAGLILAIPGGLLVQRLGVKPAILIAIAFVAAGALIGVFAGTYQVLAVSRVVEGIGFGLLGVAAPSGISTWFPKDRRGLPLGVFTTWVPFGTLVMLVVAPSLAEMLDWRAAWWFGLVFAVVVFVMIAVFFRMPNSEEAKALHGDEGSMIGKVSKDEALAVFKGSFKVLKDGRIWVLALVFALFNMVSPGGTSNFMATYLTEALHMPLTTAGFMTAAAMVGVCLCEPVCGMISDKIGSRKKIIVIPLFGLIVTSFFIFNPMLGVVGLWVCMLIHISVFSSGVSTGVYSAAPEMAGRPEYSSMAMGMVAVGQNVGLLVGPLVFSNVLAMTGSWSDVGLFWLVPAVAVTAIISLFIKAR